MGITIRSARLPDVASIAALWTTSAGPTRIAGGAADAQRLLARDPDALIVAERDGQIVGTLIVGWDGWRCHLYRMAVAADARRVGIATALFNEARVRAARLGAIRIDAMVATENDPAIAYWESLGFELDRADRRWSLLLG